MELYKNYIFLRSNCINYIHNSNTTSALLNIKLIKSFILFLSNYQYINHNNDLQTYIDDCIILLYSFSILYITYLFTIPSEYATIESKKELFNSAIIIGDKLKSNEDILLKLKSGLRACLDTIFNIFKLKDDELKRYFNKEYEFFKITLISHIRISISRQNCEDLHYLAATHNDVLIHDLIKWIENLDKYLKIETKPIILTAIADLYDNNSGVKDTNNYNGDIMASPIHNLNKLSKKFKLSSSTSTARSLFECNEENSETYLNSITKQAYSKKQLDLVTRRMQKATEEMINKFDRLLSDQHKTTNYN